MVDEHRHAHDHEHDHDHDHVDEPPRRGEELDAGGKSLSEALRISFAILKVIMIILVIAFLASGFRTVGSDEKALVLRFGKIKGVGQEAILGPGAHWVFPYPIDEMVRIPVEKNINLAIDTFWYKETRDDILGGGVKPRSWRAPTLDPLQEGYCLTGSQRSTPQTAGGVVPVMQNAAAGGPPVREGDGSDYNIVHTRWQVNYQITSVEQFFRNVYVQDVLPGEVYAKVMNRSIAPLLRSSVEDAIVKAMVHCTIDEALQSTDTIRRRVQQLVQQKLDALESGIRVVQVQLVSVTWPMQIDEAFQAYISASQTSAQMVTLARTYAETTLTKTAGQVAEPLYRALRDEKVREEQMAALWLQVTGDAQDLLAQAVTYRTEVVDRARASADYLLSILPEYRKHPELVVRQIYADRMQEILENMDEKWIIPKCDGAAGHEVRINLNRDTTLKPRPSQPRTSAP